MEPKTFFYTAGGVRSDFGIFWHQVQLSITKIWFLLIALVKTFNLVKLYDSVKPVTEVLPNQNNPSS